MFYCDLKKSKQHQIHPFILILMLTSISLWFVNSAFAWTANEQFKEFQYKLKLPSHVITEISNNQPQTIIIQFDDSSVYQAMSQIQNKSAKKLNKQALDDYRIEAITGIKKQAYSTMPSIDLSSLRDYSHLPMAAVTVSSPEALEELLKNDNTLKLFFDEEHTLMLNQSLPLINQPAAAASGNTGAGTTVVVLDTGADYTRAAFGACSDAGDPGCKIIFTQDFAADDGQLDDHGHGTNIAGTVLGVAPDANIVALDVFRITPAGHRSNSSDQIAALNWAISNQSTYNIVAANMSLGGGQFTSACSGNVYQPVFAAMRSAGILPVVASGNDAWTNAMSSPACTPGAISVGAVYDSNFGASNFTRCSDAATVADKVTCFSNSTNFLTFLAPGSMITAAGITMSGTSQATPHVAGAIAILQAARPSESIDTSVRRLELGGQPVTDHRNGITTPRIDLSGALNVSIGLDPAIYIEWDSCALNPFLPGCRFELNICDRNPTLPICRVPLDICDLNPQACLPCDPRYCDPPRLIDFDVVKFPPVESVVNPEKLKVDLVKPLPIRNFNTNQIISN